MRRALVASATALVLTGLTPLAGATPSTGLHGYVRKGPIGPCHVDQPCNRPAPGVTLMFIASDGTKIRTKTNGNGFYRVLLPAGLYGVRSDAWSDPVPTPSQVRTRRGRDARLDFEIDRVLQ